MNATVGKRGGRHIDPNSNLSKARALIGGLAATDRTRSNVITLLQDQLGLKKETASVYFYSIRKSL